MQMLESKALIQSMAQILIGFNLIGFNLILTKECEFAAQQINWHSDVRLNLTRRNLCPNNFSFNNNSPSIVYLRTLLVESTWIIIGN